MTNFLIDIAMATEAMGLGKFDGAPIVANYSTDSIVDFNSYLSSSIEYFTAKVRFEEGVQYVTMLVRTHHDHHTVIIKRDDLGRVVVLG